MLNDIDCLSLGQSGFRLEFSGTVLYIDPYLSNSVEEIEGSHQKRMVPIIIRPEKITDANFVLITHDHIDHCDLTTLIPIYSASPECIFIVPNQVRKLLLSHNFSESRIIIATDEWITLTKDVRIHPVPSAHPVIELDNEGYWICVGFLMDFNGKKIYHSGDTFLDNELLTFLQNFLPVPIVMLPVNEHNFARKKMGMLGNMSVRDAFFLAEYLQAEKMVPIHWDMFNSNAVYQDEISTIHRMSGPSFQLCFYPVKL